MKLHDLNVLWRGDLETHPEAVATMPKTRNEKAPRLYQYEGTPCCQWWRNVRPGTWEPCGDVLVNLQPNNQIQRAP